MLKGSDRGVIVMIIVIEGDDCGGLNNDGEITRC